MKSMKQKYYHDLGCLCEGEAARRMFKELLNIRVSTSYWKERLWRGWFPLGKHLPWQHSEIPRVVLIFVVHCVPVWAVGFNALWRKLNARRLKFIAAFAAKDCNKNQDYKLQYSKVANSYMRNYKIRYRKDSRGCFASCRTQLPQTHVLHNLTFAHSFSLAQWNSMHPSQEGLRYTWLKLWIAASRVDNTEEEGLKSWPGVKQLLCSCIQSYYIDSTWWLLPCMLLGRARGDSLSETLESQCRSGTGNQWPSR